MISIVHTCPRIVYRLIKFALAVSTLLLLLFGLSLIAFSVWYLYEGYEYHLDTTTSFYVSSISFIVGIVLLIISTCGFVGVVRENLFLSKLFLGFILVLLAIEFSAVTLGYIYKTQLLINASELFEGFIDNYVDDDDVRTIVDTIQSNLHCCGITSISDWNNNIYYECGGISTLACSVPASCCKNYAVDGVNNNFFCGVGIRNNNNTKMDSAKSIHLIGCKFAIYKFFERKQSITIILCIVVLIPQLCGLLLMIGFIISLNWSKTVAPKLGVSKLGVPNLIEFHRFKYNQTNGMNNLAKVNHIELKPYEHKQNDYFEPKYYNQY